MVRGLSKLFDLKHKGCIDLERFPVKDWFRLVELSEGYIFIDHDLKFRLVVIEGIS